MKPSREWIVVVSFAVFVAASPPSLANAQLSVPFDHLKCSRVQKDLRTVAGGEGLTLTSDQIETFAAQTGCRLRSAEAYQVCVPVATSPSSAPAGDDLSANYVCYKLRCDPPPSREPILFDVKDPFGTGMLQVRQRPGDSTQMLCVPSRYRCRDGSTVALPFNESFTQSDDTELPDGFVEASGDVAISGNALVSAFGGDSISVLQGISAGGVTVQADFSLASATTDASAGLLLRAMGAPGICDTSCPSFYVGRIRKAGATYRAEIVEIADCASSTLASEEVASSTGSLRFASSGSSLTLSLDSVVVATASDSSLASGTVGLLASGSGVLLDNFSANP